MEVEVAVLGSLSLIILMVYNSVDVNNTELVLVSELRSCVKVEVAVLGSLSLIILMVYNSVDVKQHRTGISVTAQELCES